MQGSVVLGPMQAQFSPDPYPYIDRVATLNRVATFNRDLAVISTATAAAPPPYSVV